MFLMHEGLGAWSQRFVLNPSSATFCDPEQVIQPLQACLFICEIQTTDPTSQS